MRNRLSGFRFLAATVILVAGACATKDHDTAGTSPAVDLATRIKGGEAAALTSLRAAAEAGDPKSQYQLGLACAEGWTGAQDLPQAVMWWRSAAERGDPDALNVVAYVYDQGIEVPRNRALALRYWQQAAEQGHAVAQYNLAATLIANSRSRDDIATAIGWLRQASDQADVESQYLLANLYASGEGLEKSPPEAMRLWRLAAEQGHKSAQLALADAASTGGVFAIDRMEARRSGRVLSKKQEEAARRIQGTSRPVEVAANPTEPDAQVAQLDSAVSQRGSAIWNDAPKTAGRHALTAVDAPVPAEETVQPVKKAAPVVATMAMRPRGEVQSTETRAATRAPVVNGGMEKAKSGKSRTADVVVAARSSRKDAAKQARASNSDRPPSKVDFRIARIDPRPVNAIVSAKSTAAASGIRTSVRVAIPAPRSQVIKVAEVRPPPAPLPSRPKSSVAPRR